MASKSTAAPVPDLTPAEFAAAHGCSRQLVMRWIETKQIPATRHGPPGPIWYGIPAGTKPPAAEGKGWPRGTPKPPGTSLAAVQASQKRKR